MSGPHLPEALRNEVEKDLRPVSPLPPVWRRTLVVAALALLVLVVAASVVQPRSDLPMWLGWGCSLLELVMGLLLVGLALREAVPGAAVCPRTAAAVVALGMVLQVAVGIVTWLWVPAAPGGGQDLAAGFTCMRHDCALALPAFVVTLWLIVRALPLRPAMAGMLGGGGAAITADAVTHLLCPMSDLQHVLVWHTGVIVVFLAAGWGLGELWGRLRWRRRAPGRG